MPLLNSLATPYAEALLQVTEARDESQTVSEQCKQLLDVWDSSAEFRDAMVSPVLEPSSKKKALESLLAEGSRTGDTMASRNSAELSQTSKSCLHCSETI